MRISAFNRSCERKQSHIYPSRSLKKVAISFDHDPILFSTANPADEVFGRHSPQQPLPDKLTVLLCFLDGVERRRRIQAALNAKQRVKLDLPADVHWMPADEVREARPGWRGHERDFHSRGTACDFGMH